VWKPRPRRLRPRPPQSLAPAAVRAILTLEETIQAWSHDTDQSDALAVARSALRSAIVCLGEMAENGTGDPADLVRPFVDALLAERIRSREAREWRPRTTFATAY